MDFLKTLIISIFMLTTLNLPANADTELWNAVDVRIPLQKENIWLPSRFDTFTVSQLAPRFDGGLGILRFSLGPQWDFTPGFSLGLLGDIIYVGIPGGKSTQEYRFNIEPVFRGKFMPELKWIDRTRIEYRYFPTRSNWRVRNLLRLNWTGFSEAWIPYLANEVFIEYPQGFNQNRSILGVRHVFDRSLQMDMGYMQRWRKGNDNTWTADHILMLFLFFAPPDYAKDVHGGE
ncbi:hypothetical protein COW36_04915 [bacterium (Candidatus Blackallbacteria) CG17_big_fil_post_rev_8_21_14_2_50_48_46]|uniref:DUF2490 domain-containing protein n=1 Tax=bacterium (Candidatus Blackallbacteria) CG17_big_fil_post_rev_8_21_14_2_50_48_46 TaxID=2014261 RepID=A0A2M7G971_9BACT|nr:MAG: hypothetical protein COW64_04030 [bacterium (Candidatus Blackallbacteria) CG18_big_fil_WC_8_21_14_2_50_49_26]PIW18637.1 MAG: hypothetical protein COW36_04915 [bacterium (Candidatus Blackallbacteria) CG17_big_fil_post_rev_8_21_14_2_50_48_46]PIW46377.1 MAG: hypothetical protein COW20_15765 [bacterium (Candidatus Blackallbacteria) CG13_big_fil_rev_8_21_14_2_50_49_14]